RGEAAGPHTRATTVDLGLRADVALREMAAQSPGIRDMVESGYAYAMFPEVGKGAVVAGVASGKGIVVQQGSRIGTVTLQQGSIGVDIGAQTYSELLVFENADALNRLKQGKLEFGASAEVVAVKAGAAATSRFDKGVKV